MVSTSPPLSAARTATYLLGMTADELGRIAYIALIGMAVGGWLFADARRQLGQTLRNLLIWACIFLGTIGAVGLWEDVRNDVAPRQLVLEDGGRIEIPISFDGHYYLELRVNDEEVEFVIDTGATDMVLSIGDAARLGINTDELAFTNIARTANGEVRTAPAVLERIEVGGIIDMDVPVVVNGGEMDASLLGMRYLRRFDRIEISDDTMVLER